MSTNFVPADSFNHRKHLAQAVEETLDQVRPNLCSETKESELDSEEIRRRNFLKQAQYQGGSIV